MQNNTEPQQQFLESQAAEPQEIVRCRPDLSLWILVVLPVLFVSFIFTAALLPPSENPDCRCGPPATPEAQWNATLSLLAIGGCILVPVIFFALWLCFAEIVADSDGLRWRGFIRHHRAGWEQVKDYYFHYLPKYPRLEIEESQKTRKLDIRNWTNHETLMKFIEQHATHAKTKAWGLQKARPEIAWPLTFNYNSDGRRWANIIGGFLGMVWLGFFVYGLLAGLGNFEEMWNYAGPFFTIIFLILYTFFALLCPLAHISARQTWQERRSRRSQSVTISTQGILFENGDQRFASSWEDVVDYYRDPMIGWKPTDDRDVVVTKHGEFDFTLIEQRFLLRYIIQAHASEVPYNYWRSFDPRREERRAQGKMTANYRSRDVRIILGIPVALAIGALIVVLLDPTFSEENSSDPAAKIIIVAIALIIWLAILQIQMISLHVDKSGVMQRTWLGVKRLNWDEVTHLRKNNWDIYKIIGKNRSIHFSPFITESPLLFDEITKHAAHAEVDESWKRPTDYLGNARNTS